MFSDLSATGCEVKRYQIVQQSDRTIVIKVVLGNSFEERKFLKLFSEISKILEKAADIRYECVLDIPRLPSGKYREFISECKRE